MDRTASSVTPFRRPPAPVTPDPATPAAQPARRPLGPVPHGSNVLRRPEVERRTGLSRSSIYRRIDKREFPIPVDLGSGAVGWYEHEIDRWLITRPRTRS